MISTNRGTLCLLVEQVIEVVFRVNQYESRRRYLDTYDADEASKYDQWTLAITDQEHDASLTDIQRAFQFSPEMHVLDAGAGTGALCLALTRVSGLNITALEPSSAMQERLLLKGDLIGIPVITGFCDHADDRDILRSDCFDVIASRMLVNCLYDPLAAFANWHHWLRPGGTVIVIDGLFDRDDWTEGWSDFVDTLPLAACRTLATVPYLLEKAGFDVHCAELMHTTNALATTRTPRYIVVASKQSE